MGHSHLAALMRGYSDAEYRKQFQCSFLPLNNEGFLPALKLGAVNPRIIDAATSADADSLLLAITGNEHNVLGIVNHPQRFDFVLPENPDLPLDESAQILPFGVITAWFTARLEIAAFPLLRQLRDAVSLPIRMVEPPPPIPSADHIAAHGEAVFKDLHERGVAPVAFRYKLWRVQTMLLRKLCDEVGIGYVPVPPVAQDADGMLAEPYWGKDATHANAAFGQLVLDDVARSLAATTSAAID